MAPSGPHEAPGSTVEQAEAGLKWLDPPPRRLTTAQLIRLVQAGIPGRPLTRRLLLAVAAAILASLVLLPDWIYSWYPTYEMTVIGASERPVPGPIEPLVEMLPDSVRGYVASFRLPSGSVEERPISNAEYDEIQAGKTSIAVHMTGAGATRGRPTTGLLGGGRLVVAALAGIVALVQGLLALALLQKRWWVIRLARRGVETVGRVTEMHSDRLVRKDRPVGRVYTLYYVFGSSSATTVEGTVAQFHTTQYHPFSVDRPLRVLYMSTPPFKSMPADFLPIGASKR
jgi:hypothetical protein